MCISADLDVKVDATNWRGKTSVVFAVDDLAFIGVIHRFDYWGFRAIDIFFLGVGVVIYNFHIKDVRYWSGFGYFGWIVFNIDVDALVINILVGGSIVLSWFSDLRRWAIIALVG